MDFQTLVEKIKNPIRKQHLKDTGGNIDYRNYNVSTPEEWKKKILAGKDLDAKESDIRDKYLNFKHRFPQKAETWLDQLSITLSGPILRDKLSPQTSKIYEKYGVQVFTDEFITESFSKESKNYANMVETVNNFLEKIKELLPNKKPRIIITNKHRNPLFKGLIMKDAPGAYRDRLIYIDQNEIKNLSLWIHEYAHFVADLIPKQTEPMLDREYKKLLDFYWRKVRKKRESLSPLNDSPSEIKRANIIRNKVALKLGFPQYGLMDRDEFFAVLIEKWNEFPNNKASYRYKTMVKGILSRL